MNQKLFRFEVDQSIRVEQLKEDTFLALANGENSFVVKISSRVKRRLYEYFRFRGQPKKFAPKVFAVGIILVLQKMGVKAHEIIVDIEYPGYELLIMDLIKITFPDLLIYFSVIGKKSPAHYAAYGAHIGKKYVGVPLNIKEINNLLK